MAVVVTTTTILLLLHPRIIQQRYIIYLRLLRCEPPPLPLPLYHNNTNINHQHLNNFAPTASQPPPPPTTTTACPHCHAPDADIPIAMYRSWHANVYYMPGVHRCHCVAVPMHDVSIVILRSVVAAVVVLFLWLLGMLAAAALVAVV
jgi:hypothetical protein